MTMYTVRRRGPNGKWCIYLEAYNVVVAEFCDGCTADAQIIGALLEPKEQNIAPSLGDISTCRICDMPIKLSPYWRHIISSPRHPAIPVEEK